MEGEKYHENVSLMCGITGIISNNKSDLTEIDKINDILIHRGPDGFGTRIFKKLAIGHRRLSIIDLSDNGTQPMHYMNRYWIVFNGEILTM